MTPDELERAVGFAKRFHAASPYASMPADDESIAAFLQALDESDAAYLDVWQSGMIGGVLVAPMWNQHQRIATELFWWSEKPGVGRALREGFEDWARGQGASALAFSTLVDERETDTREKLSQAGYSAVEIAFRKEL